MDQPVLTVQQVARYLNVHRNTIYRLAQRGGIPAFKVGSDWRFNRESIDAWRLAQERAVSSPASKPSVPSTQLANTQLRTELLDIIEWCSTEALQDFVSLSDLRLFSQEGESEISFELARMVADGLVAIVRVEAQKQYRLTPAGLSQVRSGRKKGKLNRVGHASFIRSTAGTSKLTQDLST